MSYAFCMAWRSRDERNAYQRAYRRARGVKPRLARVRTRTACVHCGAPIGRTSTKYCSIACQHAQQYADFIERWLRDGIQAAVGKVSGHIRRYLVLTWGERCALCGWCERHKVTGRIPLEVDHINGNYADNAPSNLRLLCPNCHALTPTYRALNKGRGRPYALVRRNPGA